MAEGNVRETSIALTPVGDGRFEIYLDGDKVYDRQEAGDADFYKALRGIRPIKTKLAERLQGVTALS